MYASVVIWSFVPGTLDDVSGYTEDLLAPVLRAQPGFRQYFVIRSSADAHVSVILHDTRDQAEAGFREILPLLRARHGHLVEGLARYAGDVEVSSAPS